jgi:hypothetical protein
LIQRKLTRRQPETLIAVKARWRQRGESSA